MTAKTKFARWVEKFGGVAKLAARLRVTETIVRLWLRGKGSPRAMTIHRLVTISEGQLTYAQILADTRRNMKKPATRAAARRKKRRA